MMWVMVWYFRVHDSSDKQREYMETLDKIKERHEEMKALHNKAEPPAEVRGNGKKAKNKKTKND